MTDIEHLRLEEDCRRAGVLEAYRSLVRKGNAPRFAAMLAMRQPPTTKGTDRTFFEHRHNSEYDSPVGQLQLQMAKSVGINTHGKTYVSGLADAGLGPMTPDAWVSDTHDILAVAKRKGRSVAGAVNYTPPATPPEPNIPLGEDIIRESIAEEAVKDEKFARLGKQEQREAVIDKYGPKKRTLPAGLDE